MSHDICMKISLEKYGGYGYSHILNNVVPMMINKGLEPGQINTILVDNPSKILTFAEPSLNSKVHS